MFNFNHLYYFYVTVKASTVTGAAKSLRTSQPSLSAQLKTLEQTLGKPLFRKVGRNLEVTEEGYRIFQYCQRMFETAEELSHFLESTAGSHERLRLGISEEIDRPFIVELAAKIIKNHPKGIPLVTMRSEGHTALVELLRSRVLDMIVTNQPTFDQDLAIVTSTKMPIVLAYCSGLFRKKLAPTEDIKRFLELVSNKWAMPSPKHRLRSEINGWLEKKRVSPQVAFESDVMSSVVRAIADGIGVGLIPKSYAGKEIAQGLVRTHGPSTGFWQHGLFLISRRKEPSALMLELKAVFRKVALF